MRRRIAIALVILFALWRVGDFATSQADPAPLRCADPIDFDGNQKIDAADIGYVRSLWNATCVPPPTCRVTHDTAISYHLIDGEHWPQGEAMAVTTAADDESYSYTSYTTIQPNGRLFSAIDDRFLTVGGEYYTHIGFDADGNRALDEPEVLCELEFSTEQSISQVDAALLAQRRGRAHVADVVRRHRRR